jgi:hypothetical protein
LGFGVWDLGFGVWGLGFGIWGFGFGIWGLGFGVWGLELRYDKRSQGIMVTIVKIVNRKNRKFTIYKKFLTVD